MTKHAAQELNNSDKCRGYMTDDYAKLLEALAKVSTQSVRSNANSPATSSPHVG